jgi:hypothetical protein
LYFYNGTDTIKVKNNKIDTSEVAKIIKDMDFSQYTEYSLNEKVGEENITVPVPLETTALNPVFVQSELDVMDTKAIDGIAKDFFKNNYEYVRKSVEISGNLIYIYRTEQVIKINEEGLLEFLNSNVEPDNNSDIYKSLISAIVFTKNFLGFPEDGYVSNIESVQINGNYGYEFTFSYKILKTPILFSKVRANSALEIQVLGNEVVSYKRFIRNIDEEKMNRMSEIEILPAAEVIEQNLLTNQENAEDAELKPFRTEMIKNINNVYLGYFDISRTSRDQVLRVVWVVEINDNTYVFNAITGALIEEW